MKLVTIDLDQKISWQEYDPEHEDYNDVGGSLEDFLSFADGIKGIPAVPLDKLCEWLSENNMNIPCESCKNFANEYCTAIGDKSRPCPNSADDWRRAITEWMEEPQCTYTATEP